MDDQQRRLFLALLLSAGAVFLMMFLFKPPVPPPATEGTGGGAVVEQTAEQPATPAQGIATTPEAARTTAEPINPAPPVIRIFIYACSFALNGCYRTSCSI